MNSLIPNIKNNSLDYSDTNINNHGNDRSYSNVSIM